MFLHERLPSVAIRLLVGEKEYRFKRDIEVSQSGEANLSQLALAIRGLHMIEPHSLLFYFDHSLSLFRFIDPAALLLVPAAATISDRTRPPTQTPSLSSASPSYRTRSWRTLRGWRRRTVRSAVASG
jgi:hypothetical protein